MENILPIILMSKILTFIILLLCLGSIDVITSFVSLLTLMLLLT